MSSKRVKEGYSLSFRKKKKRERIAGILARYRSRPSQGSYTCRPNPNMPINYFQSNDPTCDSHNIDQDLVDRNVVQCFTPPVSNAANVTEPGPGRNSFSVKFASWAVEQNITHSSLNKLLKMLKEEVSVSDLKALPLDSRTLLSTSSVSMSESMGKGHFVYFGIKRTIQNICYRFNIKLNQNDKFHLAVNIDGVPLFKSTNESFWPILCVVESLNVLKSEVFCVGLYEGVGKPDSNDFLKVFVEEASYLVSHGIIISSCTYEFRISKLICDSPAKSYVLKIKGHSGFFSCTKCSLEGDFDKNLHFQEVNFEKRTDNSFRSKAQPEHHVGRTLLENIPHFNMVDDVPIDYMHCLLLGVTKRLLCHKTFGWIYGKPPFKLRASQVNEINITLSKMKQFVPCEFSRKTRSIIDCKRYKATEFRLLLLYTGLIAFKDVLPKKFYNNFLCFSLGTLILCSPKFSADLSLLDYANDLFKHFIINCMNLYNPNFVSFNVHNLLHMTDCVRLFGILDNFSAFQFENYMPKLTKKVRKPAYPLEQVARRILEEMETNSNINTNIDQQEVKFCIEHNSGPLLINCKAPQYKVLKTPNFLINTSKIGDRFVELEDKSIVEVRNFAKCNNEQIFCGFLYKKISPLFYVPIDSSHFEIFVVRKENENLNMYSVASIKAKVFILPCKDKLVSFPLLHIQS